MRRMASAGRRSSASAPKFSKPRRRRRYGSSVSRTPGTRLRWSYTRSIEPSLTKTRRGRATFGSSTRAARTIFTRPNGSRRLRSRVVSEPPPVDRPDFSPQARRGHGKLANFPALPLESGPHARRHRGGRWPGWPLLGSASGRGGLRRRPPRGARDARRADSLHRDRLGRAGPTSSRSRRAWSSIVRRLAWSTRRPAASFPSPPTGRGLPSSIAGSSTASSASPLSAPASRSGRGSGWSASARSPGACRSRARPGS